MSLGEYKLPSINVMVTTVHFLAVQCISVWAARRDSVWFILLFNVFRTLFQEKQTTLSRLRQRGTEICRFTREPIRARVMFKNDTEKIMVEKKASSLVGKWTVVDITLQLNLIVQNL